MTIAVLNIFIRPLLEGKLPAWLEPRWFASSEELYELAPLADIGWFDSFELDSTYKAASLATGLKWLNTLAAGVDPFPLALLRERGVTFTNGAGLNAIPIAEYVVMGMLTVAKGWREVVRAQERHEWLGDAPGKQELLWQFGAYPGGRRDRRAGGGIAAPVGCGCHHRSAQSARRRSRHRPVARAIG